MRKSATRSQEFTPALGYAALSGVYDAAIALLTRERCWRSALVGQIDPQPTDVLLDVGCGTGSLSILLKQQQPTATVIGLDPDPDILERARRKASAAGVNIRYVQGFAREASTASPARATKAISSLVFHQTPLAEKRAGLAAMYEALAPGGELHVADFGRQRTPLMRALFVLVQLLDGAANTTPNAQGVLPELMAAVGFEAVEERAVIPTATGSISLYFARRPD